MYNDELCSIQSDWSKRSLDLMRELFPLMSPVASFEGWTDEQISTIGFLLSASARSTESLFLLTSYGQLWDAEIMLRAVMESSLKFVFLLQNKEEFDERFNEYTTAQYELSLLKDDKKTLELLSAISNPEDKEWQPLHGRLLGDGERKRISEKYERSYRSSLESRWGFTGIIGNLARSDEMFRGFIGLSYGYSLSSHILHSDYLGVALPMDRDSRCSENRNSLHLAHLARHISDAFTCMMMKLYTGYRFIGGDTEPLHKAAEKIDILCSPFRKEYERWLTIEYG